MKQISKAILEAQKEMGNATKGSTNPFFKSKYADLNAIREACMPALHNHGISVLQPTVFIDGKAFIRTVLLHESGETFEGFTEIIYSKLNDAQSQGSGITYARRYGLQSLLNIGADDDDGNKASTPKQPEPKNEPEAIEAIDFLSWNHQLANCKTMQELHDFSIKSAASRKNPTINALFTKRKVELDGK